MTIQYSEERQDLKVAKDREGHPVQASSSRSPPPYFWPSDPRVCLSPIHLERFSPLESSSFAELSSAFLQHVSLISPGISTGGYMETVSFASSPWHIIEAQKELC